ncbi:MAG: hypothetical protein Q9191_002883 [Dirinaria sp. TL-2023a]
MICEPVEHVYENTELQTEPNILSVEPRRAPDDETQLDIDGPGHLSHHGPRHNNDQENIFKIKVLPTADEILSLRRPYMPIKNGASHTTDDIAKILDLHFRHLRYDNTESIIDICYHACQNLTTMAQNLKALDYDDRMRTPRDISYSMFRDVGFEEIEFHPKHGLAFRLSFACPGLLRGKAMRTAQCLEEGMLAALIGLEPETSLISVTFVEVVRRESTLAMRSKTDNDLRGKLACLISLSDSNIWKHLA